MSRLRQTSRSSLGEGRVLQDILRGEDDHLPNVLLDAIAVVLFGEEPRQPLRAHVPGDAFRVKPGAGGLDGLVVQVRREDLDGELLLQAVHLLPQHHGQGIGLLTGGAARRPDPHRRAVRARSQEPGQGGLGERLEGLRVAEEIGHPDEQLPKEQVQLMRILVQKPQVLLRAFELVHVDAPLDAPANGVGLVGGEIVSRAGAQQHIDLLHRLGEPSFVLRLGAAEARYGPCA